MKGHHQKHSEETKIKLSIANKGNAPWNKGKTGVYSDETRKAISDTLKKKNIVPPSRKGAKMTSEQRLNMGKKISGEKHWNWKGGKTKISVKIRRSTEYKLWREAVFQRDNWTCVWCKQIGGNLNADHIKPFAYYPELRFAIDNGRTLCVDCHRTTDTYGGKVLHFQIK